MQVCAENKKQKTKIIPFGVSNGQWNKLLYNKFYIHYLFYSLVFNFLSHSTNACEK